VSIGTVSWLGHPSARVAHPKADTLTDQALATHNVERRLPSGDAGPPELAVRGRCDPRRLVNLTDGRVTVELDRFDVASPGGARLLIDSIRGWSSSEEFFPPSEPSPLVRAHAEAAAITLGIEAPPWVGVSMNELRVLTRSTEDPGRIEVAASHLRAHVLRHARTVGHVGEPIHRLFGPIGAPTMVVGTPALRWPLSDGPWGAGVLVGVPPPCAPTIANA
jgi:hypothetical protein